MRLVICIYDTPDGKMGGPIAWALDFVPFLGRQFGAVTALVLRSGGRTGSNVVDCLERIGITCLALDMNEVIDLDSQVEWIYSQCRKVKPHIVIANLVLPAMYAAAGLRRAGVRTIGVMHSDPTFDVFYRDVMKVFADQKCEYANDYLVCVSNAIGQHVENHVSDHVPLTVIPCGTRASSNVAQQDVEPIKLIYAGRLVQFQKRIRETVESLLLASERLHTPATIIGDGTERDWVEKRLGGQVLVQYGGAISQSEIQRVYAQHHVIVLLSDFEGLPIALVEAMSCGLIPIGLRSAPGVNEVIEDGVNGFLIEDRDASFLEAVEKLRDEELRQALSHAARLTVAETYSHEVVFARWENLLHNLATTSIHPNRIPRKCKIRNRNRRFIGYPDSRPSQLLQFQGHLSRWWLRTRLLIRPRARLRQWMGNIERGDYK